MNNKYLSISNNVPLGAEQSAAGSIAGTRDIPGIAASPPGAPDAGFIADEHHLNIPAPHLRSILAPAQLPVAAWPETSTNQPARFMSEQERARSGSGPAR